MGSELVSLLSTTAEQKVMLVLDLLVVDAWEVAGAEAGVEGAEAVVALPLTGAEAVALMESV